FDVEVICLVLCGRPRHIRWPSAKDKANDFHIKRAVSGPRRRRRKIADAVAPITAIAYGRVGTCGEILGRALPVGLRAPDKARNAAAPLS
ncbi:hypothetical protein, partial [Mesorhizobium sp.]|uniref:hypothetical protein n=1 Tax=Mesorhizobium sp. TaxID=1871066 RepID=UPI0025F9EB3D